MRGGIIVPAHKKIESTSLTTMVEAVLDAQMHPREKNGMLQFVKALQSFPYAWNAVPKPSVGQLQVCVGKYAFLASRSDDIHAVREELVDIIARTYVNIPGVATTEARHMQIHDGRGSDSDDPNTDHTYESMRLKVRKFVHVGPIRMSLANVIRRTATPLSTYHGRVLWPMLENEANAAAYMQMTNRYDALLQNTDTAERVRTTHCCKPLVWPNIFIVRLLFSWSFCLSLCLLCPRPL